MIALDASALLALLFREPGHERVARVLDQCAMSAVNLAEVLGRFAKDQHEVLPILTTLKTTAIRWVAFDTVQAAVAAQLVPRTRALGLSLGDRACLALAMTENIPAMTADRAWKRMDIGVPLHLIR